MLLYVPSAVGTEIHRLGMSDNGRQINQIGKRRQMIFSCLMLPCPLVHPLTCNTGDTRLSYTHSIEAEVIVQKM